MMATVCAKVFKHHKKEDGTYNVKIRVFHKNVSRYIDTEHFVSDKQLTKKMEIKDPFINQLINKELDQYRKDISDLNEKLTFFTAESLKDHLTNQIGDIDFIKFCDSHIKQLRKDGREGTASTHLTVRNSLVDYFQRPKVSIMEITYLFLKQYKRYLKTDRKLIRINQLKNEFTTQKCGLSVSGLYNHMRDLRTLFNSAREKYNDEDLGIVKIPHYPFKKYKVGSPPHTEKRNMSLKQLQRLRDCELKENSRAELARDLFMLSFYLCGMNAVDLYNCTPKNIKSGRVEYNRSKTKGRRKDNAFISIKIIEEAKPLLEKFLGKLSLMYSSHEGPDTALSIGTKKLREITGISGITFYWARHTFANLGRNSCRMSVDDVALALNHIEHGHKTTDIYISKDWKIVDEAQLKVVGLLRTIDGRKKSKS
jgi:integrase